MKAGIAAAVALAGVLLSGGAQASDGNDLLHNCQLAVRLMDGDKMPPDDILDSGKCFGMVEGVQGTLMNYERQIPQNLRGCFPDGGIKNAQAVRVVSKYLHENPAKLNIDASTLTILAYIDAFPCK